MNKERKEFNYQSEQGSVQGKLLESIERVSRDELEYEQEMAVGRMMVRFLNQKDVSERVKHEFVEEVIGIYEKLEDKEKVEGYKKVLGWSLPNSFLWWDKREEINEIVKSKEFLTVAEPLFERGWEMMTSFEWEKMPEKSSSSRNLSLFYRVW